MKHCSLDNFTQSLLPWLNDKYIRNVAIHDSGKVVFVFKDGITNTYRITDCNKKQIRTVCKDLSNQGIAVERHA